ncbi:hypothetical protein SNOG_16325 [Parastagonospora nodorum SN15]|uniref:Uncharacterized protein n=1 Tax=Phaeosphaeria nodorum (strain SN15 / ATCC MYA-4574 / FGSC 10173) TaxID=321614 RepID=Q0TW04_PHANO|nr:hypothetical protein SNOG_16325 [Parastagonospora nodorum SN15]EAT76311.2 hypothetical protein SNOG_16325 [Parastagonospora nodorum SN15]
MGTSEQGPSKSPHTSPAGANLRGLNDVHVDADANAADSSQDGTYVDDDALASSRPPRIHLRECDDDDELQRAAQTFIGDERHPLPEPKREKRCASEPILCRRATETSEDELQESSTADKQVQLTGAESMEKEKAEWTSDGEIGAETSADGVVA